MSGQIKVCDSKKELMDEYIKKYDPYTKRNELKFDLRGYSSYVETHNLNVEDITPDIMNMFVRKGEI